MHCRLKMFEIKLLLLLFPISFFCLYLPLLMRIRIIICYYLHLRVFNPESEYSTPQLLTSDSRYSYSLTCSIYRLLTSDSSCLISCQSRTQPCCIVQLPYTDVPPYTMMPWLFPYGLGGIGNSKIIGPMSSISQ